MAWIIFGPGMHVAAAVGSMAICGFSRKEAQDGLDRETGIPRSPSRRDELKITNV